VAAGITDKLWSRADIVAMDVGAPKPGPRKAYAQGCLIVFRAFLLLTESEGFPVASNSDSVSVLDEEARGDGKVLFD